MGFDVQVIFNCMKHILIFRFINREDVDFDSVEDIQCDQEWELVRDIRNEYPDYPTR